MTPWTSVLKAIGVESGQFSSNLELEHISNISLVTALLLMPVIAFFPGGAFLHLGEWAVLPLGVTLLLFALVMVSEYSYTAGLIVAWLLCAVALGAFGWAFVTRSWDGWGLAKVGLVTAHALVGQCRVIWCLRRARTASSPP